MKKWMIVVDGVLILAIAVLGVSNARLNGEIRKDKSEMAALKSDVSKLQLSPLGSSTVTMIDLISTIQPVVVRVDASGSGILSSGSGVVIRNDGYLITNQHVVEGATSIEVTSNTDEQLTATIISSDSRLDLAILKIAGSAKDLHSAVLGSAADIVPGGTVVAAGFPLGGALSGTASFTQGIISAIRTLNGQRFIQTDVQINPGNSGGALIARGNGRLIGITTANVAPLDQDIEGIGLAIPIDVVQAYIQANLTK